MPYPWRSADACGYSERCLRTTGHGTVAPPPGTNISMLNQCPLNACCDIWGQCGTTSGFCVPGTPSTGAPGTATPGQSGCIPNCGTEIVKGKPPKEFKSIAYFEGFDDSRPCLRMSVSHVDRHRYTHLHFAFATLTPSFDVDISTIAPQFQDFVNLSGIKRIISFGGWKFSTSVNNYDVFREAVHQVNRATLVANLVAFLNKYNFDGIDIDWEYPGAPDILVFLPHRRRTLRTSSISSTICPRACRATLPARQSPSLLQRHFGICRISQSKLSRLSRITSSS